MKKIILLTGMLCALIKVNAQTTQSVSFDNYVSASNNDLKNKFIGSYTFSQLTTGGITGGAIAITGENGAANYNLEGWAAFKDTFDINAQSLNASVCFKYIPNTNMQEAPAKIKIQTVGVESWSMSDFLNAFYEYNGPNNSATLRVESISTSTSTSIHNDLITGHWYKLSLNMQKGAGVSFIVSLNDLGASGTATPVLIASRSGSETITDFFKPEYDVMVGITGSHAGGAEYLDNFSVTGTTLTGPTGIKDTRTNESINMPTLVNDILPVTTNGLAGDISYVISDINGKVVFRGKLNGNTNIDISGITSGNYFASFSCTGSKMVKKFIKQ